MQTFTSKNEIQVDIFITAEGLLHLKSCDTKVSRRIRTFMIARNYTAETDRPCNFGES